LVKMHQLALITKVPVSSLLGNLIQATSSCSGRFQLVVHFV